MLFNIQSACSSPEFLTLEDFDFDFDNMSPRSSSSPGSDRDDSAPPPLPSMSETFPTLEHSSPYPEDRSSMGDLRYLLQDRKPPAPETTRSHLPYNNYPVNPESTLITPGSISAEDHSLHSLPVRPRSETPHYQSYTNLYPNTSNPPRTSAPEEHSYNSPFHFYENEPQQIPTPYWGSYNVSPPSHPSPPPRPVLIAPQPPRTPGIKRQLEEDTAYYESQQARKRPSLTREVYPRETIPVERKQQGLNKEEQVLVHLKEDLKLPWKDITARWAQEIGRTKQEAALQMQYKRLKERLRVWTTGDLRALSKAIQKVDNMRWEAISQSMLDFGIQEKWTRQACQAKWESLDERELELVRELCYSPPPPAYWCDDSTTRYSSNGSGRSLTPDSVKGSSSTASHDEFGISPQQLLISNRDGYHDRYVPQHDWSSYIT